MGAPECSGGKASKRPREEEAENPADPPALPQRALTAALTTTRQNFEGQAALREFMRGGQATPLLPGEVMHPALGCEPLGGKGLGLLVREALPAGTLLLRSAGLFLESQAGEGSIDLEQLLQLLTTLHTAAPEHARQLLGRVAQLSPRPVQPADREAYVRRQQPRQQSTATVGPCTVTTPPASSPLNPVRAFACCAGPQRLTAMCTCARVLPPCLGCCLRRLARGMAGGIADRLPAEWRRRWRRAAGPHGAHQRQRVRRWPLPRARADEPQLSAQLRGGLPPAAT